MALLRAIKVLEKLKVQNDDQKVGVVEHVFNDDVAGALEEFRAELYSASFDTRRLAL